MNKKGFFDLEMDGSTMMAAIMGVIEGIVVLFMMKFSGTGVMWRIIAALVSMVAGFFVTKFIIDK